MLEAKNVLTIGIDYRVVHGGVAAVESVYSTFYLPFNHVATVVDYGQARKLRAFFKAYVQFWKWMLWHKEIEIVHVHGASDASFWRKRIFINLAKKFGKKVVYHMHGGGFENFSHSHPKAVGSLIAKCDAIIALSSYWKSFFENELHCKNVVVVKNVIAQPVIAPIPSTTFSLLFLGLLGVNKGVYDLLDCLYEHKEEFCGKLRLYIGGNGEVEKVKRLIVKYGIEDIVSFEGWVWGEKKTKLLNMADAYILPSYNEGLPISILEAMSYSLPIISTTVGGIPEIVKNGENGFLIEPGDKDAMYQAINQLKDNHDMCVNMGKKSKEKVKEHLPEYVERQLSSIYSELLKKKGGVNKLI